MARPIRKAPDRWRSPNHTRGYCKPVGEIAWMFYSPAKKSTGLRFSPVSKSAALEMLDA